MLELRNGSMDKFFSSRGGMDSLDNSNTPFNGMSGSLRVGGQELGGLQPSSGVSGKLLDSKEFPSLGQRSGNSGSSGSLGLNGGWPPLSANASFSTLPGQPQGPFGNSSTAFGGANPSQVLNNPSMLAYHHAANTSKGRVPKSGMDSPSDNFGSQSTVAFSIETEDFPALPSQLNMSAPLGGGGGVSDNRFLNEHHHANDFSNSNDTFASSNRGLVQGMLDLHQRHGQKPPYSLLGDRSAAGFSMSSSQQAQQQQTSSHFLSGALSGASGNSSSSTALRPLLSSGAGAGNVSTPPNMPPHPLNLTAQQQQQQAASHLNSAASFPNSGFGSLLGSSGSTPGTPSTLMDHHHHLSLQQQQQQAQQQQQRMAMVDSKKLRFVPQSGVVENVPTSMLQDEYGLCAMAMWLQTGSHLTPVEDLKDFFQFNNKDAPLYQNFQSPLTENFPGRPHDMDWVVPEEYHIRHQFYKQLADLKVTQLTDDTLFWIFYNCCGEDAQAVAAKALHSRDWRFNNKLQVWITRIPGEPRTQHMNGETSVFHVWEPRECRRVPRRLMIQYSDLDTPPDMCCDKLQVAANMSVAQLPPRPGLLISAPSGGSSTSGTQQQQQTAGNSQSSSNSMAMVASGVTGLQQQQQPQQQQQQVAPSQMSMTMP